MRYRLRVYDLVGTWRLVEWTVTVGDGPPLHPFGGDPDGLLTYTADGRMWAALMRRNRAALGTRTLAGASPAQRAETAAGYLSYAGTFQADDEGVTHHVEVSLFPDWIGGDQRRLVRWVEAAGGVVELELSSPPDTTSDGRVVVNRLRWRKVDVA